MDRHERIEDQLAKVPLFSGLSKKELRLISQLATYLEEPAGTVLTEEGKPGHEFFLIINGSASVKRGKREIAKLGPGQYFGELALLDRGPRSPSVVAKDDMEVLVLGQREFAGVIDEVPNLAHKLLTTMAQRLREADAKAYSH